eukprot:m.250020 g.250020  ORF g.250020 m.250020 type:complete len:62 (-) comp17172_c0_seq3:669-854(-)
MGLFSPGVANLPEEKPSAMDIDVKEDPYDWDIYMQAARIFAEQLQIYGLEVPSDLRQLLNL